MDDLDLVSIPGRYGSVKHTEQNWVNPFLYGYFLHNSYFTAYITDTLSQNPPGLLSEEHR